MTWSLILSLILAQPGSPTVTLGDEEVAGANQATAEESENNDEVAALRRQAAEAARQVTERAQDSADESTPTPEASSEPAEAQPVEPRLIEGRRTFGAYYLPLFARSRDSRTFRYELLYARGPRQEGRSPEPPEPDQFLQGFLFLQPDGVPFILRREEQTIPRDEFQRVIANGPRDILVIGRQWYRWNGMRWLKEPPPRAGLTALAPDGRGWLASTRQGEILAGPRDSLDVVYQHPDERPFRQMITQGSLKLALPDRQGVAIDQGSGWSYAPFPKQDDPVRDIWSGGDALSMLTQSGEVWTFQGGQWVRAPELPPGNWIAATGGLGRMAVVGLSGKLALRRPAGWLDSLPQSSNDWYAAAMQGQNGLAVGTQGALLRWEDDTTTLEPAPVGSPLLDVAISDSGMVLAAGADGVLAEQRGDAWTQIETETANTFRAVAWGEGPRALAAGDAGMVWLRTQDGWTALSFEDEAEPGAWLDVAYDRLGDRFVLVDGTRHLILGQVRRTDQTSQGIWRLAATSSAVYGLGRDDRVYRLEGETWVALPSNSPTEAKLHAAAAQGNALVIVGERGVIWTSQDAGQSWQLDQIPGASDLNDVAFLAGSALIVGDNGLILRDDAGGWRRESASTGADLLGIAQSGNELRLLGRDGAFLRWMGDRWLLLPEPVERDLIAWQQQGRTQWLAAEGGIMMVNAYGEWEQAPIGDEERRWWVVMEDHTAQGQTIWLTYPELYELIRFCRLSDAGFFWQYAASYVERYLRQVDADWGYRVNELEAARLRLQMDPRRAITPDTELMSPVPLEPFTEIPESPQYEPEVYGPLLAYTPRVPLSNVPAEQESAPSQPSESQPQPVRPDRPQYGFGRRGISPGMTRNTLIEGYDSYPPTVYSMAGTPPMARVFYRLYQAPNGEDFIRRVYAEDALSSSFLRLGDDAAEHRNGNSLESFIFMAKSVAAYLSMDPAGRIRALTTNPQTGELLLQPAAPVIETQ